VEWKTMSLSDSREVPVSTNSPTALLHLETATQLLAGCLQLDGFQSGLMQAVLGRDSSGRLIRKAGIMSIVLVGGEVAVDDRIEIELPPPPHRPLDRV
jgi:MOSC domain-containing protein YiiM